MSAERELARLGEDCGEFAIRCSDAAGFVAQVNHRIAGERSSVAALQESVAGLASLQSEAHGAAGEIRAVARKASALLDDSHREALSALDEIGVLIDDVVRMGDRLDSFVTAIERVGRISGELDTITRETRILAINATIEGARTSGGAGGFAVVASEMKRLAAHAREATGSVTGTISGMEREARGVSDDIRHCASRGREVRARADTIGRALQSIAALVTQFDQRSATIEAAGEQVTAHVGVLERGLADFTNNAVDIRGDLDAAVGRLDELESASNAMLDRVAHSGAETPDSPFIALALSQAGDVAARIQSALRDGLLARADLFDERYVRIDGTDPPQFLTGFTEFADNAIRPLLDATTLSVPEVVGCCLIDRNGYLPTHISERSQPQRPGERRWNVENSRNRQMFMDHQTRAALDREGDWFLHTYRQDFGDGRYRPLRSVFVPLSFGGIRWGLYELGYLI
jgi:methyl-accepting chemotaxis protein